MKLHSDPSSALNTVTAYGDDYIEVNSVPYSHAVWFGPEGPIHQWSVRAIDEVTAATLRQPAGLIAAPNEPLVFLDAGDCPPADIPGPDSPEVLIVGTGLRQHLLHPAVCATITRVGIGVEAMDTQAAARTYNILMSEGRRVIVALMPIAGAQP